MDWTPIVALVGSSAGLAVACFLAYRSGRNSVLKEQAEKTVEVKHEQLKAVVNRPDSDDRLSKGTF